MTNNVISERIVLGCLLNNSEWIIDVPNLKIQYFENESHRAIFFGITKMLENKGTTIDDISLYAYCSENASIKEIIDNDGGLDYLSVLKKVTQRYELKDFIERVKALETNNYRKKAIENQKKILQKLESNSSLEITEMSSMINGEQATLDVEFTSSNEIGFFGDKVDSVWEEIKSNAHNGVVGLESKFKLVNKYFTYRKGELVVVGGRPKGGKTVFAINEAHELAINKGIPVLYIDTEMQDTTFLARLVALETQLTINEIERMTYLDSEVKKNRVEKALKKIAEAPLIHEYLYDYDMDTVKKIVALAKRKFNIQFVIYDYIKVKEVAKNGIQEHNELGNWTIFLKDLAGEFQVPILSMAQMSKHEIRLADSDKINRYASTICYLLKYSHESIKDFDGCCEITKDGLEVNRPPQDYIFVDYNRNGAMMEDTSKGINLDFDRKKSTMTLSKIQFSEIEYVDGEL